MCVCVFVELHITAQSGPVILVILCVYNFKLSITAQPALSSYYSHIDSPKGGSMIFITETSNQARQRGQAHSLYLYSSYLNLE